MNITLRDGNVDLITEEAFKVPFYDRFQSDGYAFRFKVKEGLSEIKLPFGKSGDDTLIAIDWGLNEPITREYSETHACGEEVTLFLVNNFNDYGSLDPEWLSAFLSQIDTLHTPFPIWLFNTSGIEIYLEIDSPEFKAPNGIFEELDIVPYFAGSTFKVGPKIWADLSESADFPPRKIVSDAWDPLIGEYIRTRYAPFADCPNLKSIEYQGQFGEEIETLTACDFTFYDENGYGNPSAYPDGGAPRLIDEYVIIEDYSFESSYNFPQFDQSRLEKAIRPAIIGTLHIGKQTVMGTPALPVGINVNDAPKLKYVDHHIPKISIQSGNYTGEFYYGAKALGIKIPDAVEFCFGAFSLNDSYVEEIGNEDEPIPNNPFYEDVLYPLTPLLAKTGISFPYGQALDAMYPNNEETLGMPDPSPSMRVVSNYGKRIARETAGTYVTRINRDTWGFYQLPALPEGCEIIDGYAENLYSRQTLGAEVELEAKDGTIITVTGGVTIPKLPSTTRVVRNYLKRTFAQCRGKGEGYPFLGTVQPKVYLFYGEPADDYSNNAGMNLITTYTPDPTGEVEKEFGQKFMSNESRGAEYLEAVIEDMARDSAMYFKMNLLEDGVTLESGPLPQLEYAVGWMEETWDSAVVNPEKLTDLIVPIPEGVKTEKAYLNTLRIALPQPQGRLSKREFTTWGRPNSRTTAKSEAEGYMRYCTLVMYQNPMRPEDQIQFRWDLSKINLPTVFLKNEDGQVYDAYYTFFRNVYGDPDAFFDTRGVDDDVQGTPDRKSYLQLLDLGEINSREWPRWSFYFTWNKRYLDDTSGTSSDSPYYEKHLSIPRIEPHMHTGGRPEKPAEPIEYWWRFATINTDPDTPSEDNKITSEYDADWISEWTAGF